MNREYLEGFQSATINIIENGLGFATETMKQFIEQDDYTSGYAEGTKMMTERLNKQDAINRTLDILEGIGIAKALEY